MTPAEFDKILERYQNNTATEEEKALVENWFENISNYSDASFTPEATSGVRDKLWSNVKPSRRFNYLPVGIAAAVVIFASLFIYIFHSTPVGNGTASRTTSSTNLLTFTNSKNYPSHVELHDGSVITLEPNAEVKVPEKFSGVREVYLTGEAFFEIAKDAQHPFLVYTNDVTTRVLGTSFRIKATEPEKEIIVAVKTGRVSVLTPNETADEDATKQETVLTPNQQVVYRRSDNKVMRQIVDDPRVLTNQPALKSAYVNEPVVKILESLEESYGIDFQYDAEVLSNCTLTSDMSDVGLYERIDIICNAIGARYAIDGVTVMIDAKPCH